MNLFDGFIAAVFADGEGGGASSAADVSYNNANSGLDATNVQDAVDELNREKFGKDEALATGILGIDSTPTLGSNNLVTSDGVAAAISAIEDATWTDAQRLAALLRMGCTVDDDGFVKWAAQTEEV